MNPTFLAANLSYMNVTGSHAPLAGAGFSNLLDYRLDTFWASSFGGNQNLSFSFATDGVPIDAFALTGQNFDELFEVGSPTIILKSSTTSGFDLATSSVCTISASSDAQIYTFPTTNRRFFRLEFSGTIGTPRIGEVAFGRAFSVSQYEVPFRIENVEPYSFDAVSLNGNVRTTTPYNARVRQEVRLDLITESSRSALLNMIAVSEGRLRPLFFRTAEGITRYVRFMVDYQPIDFISHERNRTQTLEMRTQNTSDGWDLRGPAATGSLLPTIYGLPDRKFVIDVS